MSAAISNQSGCTRTSKQKQLSTRITSVHRHSRAITASASFETIGTMLFPSFLNSKKTRDCSPSIWTPSSKAECSTSSQSHADRSTATKERFWSSIYISTKIYRKQLTRDLTKTCSIPTKKQNRTHLLPRNRMGEISVLKSFKSETVPMRKPEPNKQRFFFKPNRPRADRSRLSP